MDEQLENNHLGRERYAYIYYIAFNITVQWKGESL